MSAFHPALKVVGSNAKAPLSYALGTQVVIVAALGDAGPLPGKQRGMRLVIVTSAPRSITKRRDRGSSVTGSRRRA